MEPGDDKELMLRVRDGQEAAAFEELMRRYQRPLTGFLMRLTANLDVAQDLAEETFVRVWQSAPRYRPSAKFTTWLFTIASRLATDHARRAQVRRAVPLDAPAADDARSPAETLPRTSNWPARRTPRCCTPRCRSCRWNSAPRSRCASLRI